MEKNLVLYGNGCFAQLMKWYIEHDSIKRIAAFTVEKDCIASSEFEGLPLIPFEEIESQFTPSKTEILICIGYTKMNNIRKRIFYECKKKGYGIAQFIHSSAILSDVKLGEGNIILENTLIEPFVSIGSCNLIWYKSTIAHNCMIGDFNTITGMVSICGFVEIKNNCFIGSGAIIRDKLRLNDYTLLGAATYLAHDTQKYNVIVAQKGIVLSHKNSLDFFI